ncbi:MAG: holin family protein [Patescibacteria group bacterium]|nr:holin family protein [Patescibacteria group bacterium]
MAVLGIPAVASLAKDIIDKIWPDKSEEEKQKLTQEFEILQGQMALQKGQIDVNKAEAANPNWFVAGWRPFIGWVGGLGLTYQFLGLPLLTWASTFAHIPPPPAIDTQTLFQLVLSLLGLGGFRTFEKIKGAANNH